MGAGFCSPPAAVIFTLPLLNARGTGLECTTGQRKRDDETRNWGASVELEEAQLSGGTKEALTEVIALVRGIVPPRYRKVVSMGCLMALQPNRHNSNKYVRTNAGISAAPPNEMHHGGAGLIVHLCICY